MKLTVLICAAIGMGLLYFGRNYCRETEEEMVARIDKMLEQEVEAEIKRMEENFRQKESRP